MDKQTGKKELAYFMRRLYRQGLTTCSGGNISLRLEDDTLLITPSALDKGRIRSDQIGHMTLTGENLTPTLKPSIETDMHRFVYLKRPNIRAIVHAHPPLATSFTASHQKINCNLIAESRAIIGVPVFAPYALMGTPELARLVSEAAQHGNVILMENHGILTVGETLLRAFDRLEVIEASAKMTLVTTSLLGSKKELNEHQQAELDQLF